MGQDFTMPPSKLEPFPKGQGIQKARCGTRPGVGCPCPGLSSGSPPPSPQPHYHEGGPTLPVTLTWGSATTAHDPIFAVAAERERGTEISPSSHCRARRPRVTALRLLQDSERHAHFCPWLRAEGEGGCRFMESFALLNYL